MIKNINEIRMYIGIVVFFKALLNLKAVLHKIRIFSSSLNNGVASKEAVSIPNPNLRIK